MIYISFLNQFIFPHMKTHLAEPSVQIGEATSLFTLMIISTIIIFFVTFKTSIILGYVIYSQALTAFIRFQNDY